MPTGTEVGSIVTISDNMTLSYAITAGNAGSNFIINSNGLLTTTNTIDYESTTSYSLIVMVTSGDNKTDSNTITVNVIDVDEVPPVIANQSFPILENVPIGTIVGAVNATDNESITNYAIIAGNTSNAFTISRSGLLTTANTIDYEITSIYNLNVKVTDGAGNTASNTITVNISDVNLPPNVTTSGPSGILVTEAVMHGSVTDLGDSSVAISEHGFIYTTISSESHIVPGAIGVEKTNLGTRSTTGQFSSRLTELEECRTYYYRAYAVNQTGTNFSEVRSFTPGRQHQTNNLSGATDGEQSGLICPYGTHTYNIPLSNTHAYNLTVDGDNNVLDSLVIYEDNTTNELYVQAGPFSILLSGTATSGDTNAIITFSGTDSGRRYLVLPLSTTNHRLVLSNNNVIEKNYTLSIGEETNTSGELTGRLLTDETTMRFTNNDPEFYWVHMPPNSSILDGSLTAITTPICAYVTGISETGYGVVELYGMSEGPAGYDQIGNSFTNNYIILRIFNNDSNVDYRGCQFKFRTR